MTIAVIPKDQREKVDSGFPNEKEMVLITVILKYKLSLAYFPASLL